MYRVHSNGSVLVAPGDTTWIGHRAGNAGNYWEVGAGPHRPGSGNNDGMWTWDDGPVHGDSLQGWWPVHRVDHSTGGLTFTDDQRPWWAIDVGNNANYTIAQGPGAKRTFGVVGVWHRDPGNTGSGVGQGVGWTPLSGNYSAWCGLRRHGDLTATDGVTGNAFNDDVLMFNELGGGSSTAKKFPGYGSQWDQMLYRDLVLSGSPGAPLTLSFKYKTRMSTGYGTSPSSRTGWFDKDPLTLAANNFISSSAAGTSAPIDSFMVYVGAPVDSSFVGSDGATHSVYDPQRRWFSEVIRANEPSLSHHEVFTTYGNQDGTAILTIPNAQIAPLLAASGGRLRLVFRSKTNRDFDDETGGLNGAYSSGGQGAVVLDDVIANGITIGDFEGANDINNEAGVSALDAWKSTGKPPASYFHVHNLSSLVYQDLCGPLGSPTRLCNLTGNVISIGDHDRSEAAGGVYGTADQERFDEFVSPVICLKAPGPTTPNGWDITGNMVAGFPQFYVFYDVYPGVMADIFTYGNYWEVGVQAYPAKQIDGVPTWSGILNDPFEWAGVNECISDFDFVYFGNSTSNPSGVPDSVRIVLTHAQECLRFGVTTNCSSTAGGYFDNVALAIVQPPPSAIPAPSVESDDLFQDTFPFNETASLPGTAAFDTTAALVKTGHDFDESNRDVPGDSLIFTSTFFSSQPARMDLVFRILPGPGNYVTAGSKASGLRLVPTNPTPVNYANASNNGNFWAEYLRDNGAFGTPGGHPAGAVNGGKIWDPNVWNSARMDSLEGNIWPIVAFGVGQTQTGVWMSTYNETDPKFTKLGIAKNRCWYKDPVAGGITCDLSQTVGDWPVTAGYVAENGLPLGQTYEYTKIIPDGLLTPGSHVEYFLRGSDPTAFTMTPDTTLVTPQVNEGSTDAHRWEEFSVLPDLWKKAAYGGLGNACLLVVDNADGLGEEAAWAGIADTLGLTQPAKFGANNGWHAPGGSDPNDPTNFIAAHGGQAGSSWDLYNVKAIPRDNFDASGSIGSRYSNRSGINGGWSTQGPTHEMLNAYYNSILVLTGPSPASFGPYGGAGSAANVSADDIGTLQSFLTAGTSGQPHGLIMLGGGLATGLTSTTPGTTFFSNYLKSGMADQNYLTSANVYDPGTELALGPGAGFGSSGGDQFGLVNRCDIPSSVLNVLSGGVLATEYRPSGILSAPLAASVLHPQNGSENWVSLVDGFNLQNLVTMSGTSTVGRSAYIRDVLSNLFGAVCNFSGLSTADVPGFDGRAITNYFRLAGNPMENGRSAVEFGLAASDRVEARVYDISGRLVRTLADRQFPAGQHQLVWDGVDDRGARLTHGVYFVRLRYQKSGFVSAKKLVMVR